MNMRTFHVASTHDLSSVSIQTKIEEHFGSTESEKTESITTYRVTEPRHPLAESVSIRVRHVEQELDLSIETLSVDTVREKNLTDSVPSLVQAKNAFLEDSTGKTVEDRKQEMYREVLPIEKDVIEYPTVKVS